MKSSRLPPLHSSEIHRTDSLFFQLLQTFAWALLGALGLLLFFLLSESWPIVRAQGVGFWCRLTWDPVREIFGALPMLYGTLVSSLLALLLATPLGVGGALFLTEGVPSVWGRRLGFLVEMLAAIPSLVYGLWGAFVLVPWMKQIGHPILSHWLGFLPFFQGSCYGVGLLTSSLVLSLMITPTLFSITREVFLAVPKTQKESALALGATRWEALWVAVLLPSLSGIQGALLLGLSRALGETMAVTLLIGNRPDISLSLFEPAQTLASLIANEYPEASSELHLSALVAMALFLFLLTLSIHGGTRFLRNLWTLRRP